MYCRLCTYRIVQNYQYLYDENGLPTEIYRLTYKYFPTELSEAVCASSYVPDNDYRLSKVVCLNCWSQIYQFSSYQEGIELLQLQYQNMQQTIAIPLQSAEKKESTDDEDHLEIVEIDSDKSVETRDNQTPIKMQKFNDEFLTTSEPSTKKVNDVNELIRQHFENSIPCAICLDNFQQIEDLKLHMLQSHNSPFYMKCCKRKFSTMNNIIKHIQAHQSYLKCPKCQSFFHSQKRLLQHTRSSHEIVCQFCSQHFENSNDLRLHLAEHDDENPFKCSFCNRIFLNNKGLQLHLKALHPDECSNNVTAKKILQSSKDMSKLVNDTLSSCETSGSNNSVCMQCEQKFPTSRALIYHTCSETMHKCTDCGRKFLNQKLLFSHRRIHRKRKERMRWIENCQKFTATELEKIYNASDAAGDSSTQSITAAKHQ